jgi:hypothetical protein
MQHKFLLEQYFSSANAHDIAKTLNFFSGDSVVRDEGREHRGLDAIREWLDRTNAEYNTQQNVLSISVSEDEVDVVASVSGTFPGSPIQLTSRFTIRDGKISSLVCGV